MNTYRISRLIQGMVLIACSHYLTHQAQAGALGSALDRRYDQNTYLASHNSFANVEDYYNPLAANQVLGITHQLDIGVRCLLLDVWFMRQRAVLDPILGLPLYMESQIYKKRNDYASSS